ncbi:MAG TPA: hypothetical protein VNE39_27815 [Planctomycetota bacterium]|nr:hypothetical protein [Planctomycetota bacterium]
MFASRFALALVAIAAFASMPMARAEETPKTDSLPTFTVTEHFGVSHPDQIIDFDLPAGVPASDVHLVETATRRAVPFQFLEEGRKLAVRTDLPAGATKSWALLRGRGPAPAPAADGVTVSEREEGYEIVNGLTGVRVPKAAATLDMKRLPAPVQGVRLRDGRWSATGPNLLNVAQGPTAKAMAVRFRDRGPLVTVVEIEYGFARPDALYDTHIVDHVDPASNAIVLDAPNYFHRFHYWQGASRPAQFVIDGAGELPKPLRLGTTYYLKEAGSNTYQVSETPDGPALALGSTFQGKVRIQGVIPAGPGRYRSTIAVEAGQPSLLFEEDTDLDFSYSLNFYGALEPTHARYRGHHADRKELGYEPDGRAYRPEHARPPMDAQYDLRYDRSYPSSWRSSIDEEPTIGRMALWDPWATNSGRYWQMFSSKASGASPLVGIFAGRASRAIGAPLSGPGFYTSTSAGGATPAAGITVSSERRSPSATVFPHSRFQWGLFVGTKGSDLKPPTEVQPIQRQMNLHGGVNLNKVHRYQLDFPDPPQGYGAMYVDKAAMAKLIQKVRTDENYYRWACNAEPTARDLLDFWRDTSGEKSAKLVAKVTGLAREILGVYVNGDGVYSFWHQYWMGGLRMSPMLLWIDQLLGSDQVGAQDKGRLKAVAVLFASVLYDNDFVPLDNHESFNLGTPNMPVQQQNYRQMFALFLARHPTMADRVKGLADAARGMLRQTINEHGAHMGSLHYVEASNCPLLATFQQLQTAGVYDAFKQEDRLAKFAEFYMQALTPPEVRRDNLRKIPAIGDGSTQATEEYGTLGTGFAKCNPELSARLMGAWREEGKHHTAFGGSSLLKIDDTLPSATPNLGDARFPGYYSVLRSGWGTPQENALWCVNGNFYRDHSHNDLGSLVIYALGAPLSLDWGCIYTPRAAGGVMHSTVVQESAFGQPWNEDIKSLEIGGGFSQHYGNISVGEATAVESFPEGRRMVSTVRCGAGDKATTWVRAVTLVNADPAAPVILIRDTFSGAGASAPKIWAMNLMADGAVETPAGKQTPTPRTHPPTDKGDANRDLPSAGPVFALRPGVNRLGFTGQVWKAHATQGIDWDLYVIPAEDQQAQIGNWACQEAISGTAVQERQHILRVRGRGTFTTVIIPWAKGRKPADLTVKQNGDAVVVTTAAGTTRLDPHGFAVAHAGTTVRRAFEK